MIDQSTEDQQDMPQGLIFPCDYPVKAMGLATAGMQDILARIITDVLKDQSKGVVRQRPSTNGRFVSVTMIVSVSSRGQLEKIYRALSDHKDVLMTL